jgi:hypothetical protein
MIDVTSRKVLNPEVSHGVYICHYTSKTVRVEDAIFLGAILPSVSGSYVCHKDAAQARKESARDFDQFEKNCNTCKKLERVPHDKFGGFMKGKCEVKGIHSFHPDDPMFMECWEERA